MNSIKDYVHSLSPLYENETLPGYIYRELMIEVYEAYQGSYVWHEVVKAVKEEKRVGAENADWYLIRNRPSYII